VYREGARRLVKGCSPSIAIIGVKTCHLSAIPFALPVQRPCTANYVRNAALWQAEHLLLVEKSPGSCPITGPGDYASEILCYINAT
jgi:hypothetical protein